MESLLISHPAIVIICALVLGFLGKYLWVSKDKGHDIEDTLKGANHQLELSFVKGVGEMGEKMRIVQNEIMHDVDEKYFTKEMAKDHEQRITKVEESIAQIIPRMEKIDLIYEQLQKHAEHK